MGGEKDKKVEKLWLKTSWLPLELSEWRRFPYFLGGLDYHGSMLSGHHVRAEWLITNMASLNFQSLTRERSSSIDGFIHGEDEHH